MTATNAEPQAIRILRDIIEGDDAIMSRALDEGRNLLQLVRVSGAKGEPADPPLRIMALVATVHGLTVPAMLERNRTKKVVAARQTAMWLCRKVLNLTFEEIGERFARNHGTVIHAIETVDDYVDTDAGYRANLTDLQAKAAALCGRASA